MKLKEEEEVVVEIAVAEAAATEAAKIPDLFMTGDWENFDSKILVNGKEETFFEDHQVAREKVKETVGK